MRTTSSSGPGGGSGKTFFRGRKRTTATASASRTAREAIQKSPCRLRGTGAGVDAVAAERSFFNSRAVEYLLSGFFARALRMTASTRGFSDVKLDGDSNRPSGSWPVIIS